VPDDGRERRNPWRGGRTFGGWQQAGTGVRRTRESSSRLGKDSGKTLSAFAQQHGVDPRRMARWRSRLRRATPAAVRFHPVQMAVESAACQDGSAIEIELGGGRRVRVGPGFDVDDPRVVRGRAGHFWGNRPPSSAAVPQGTTNACGYMRRTFG